MSKLQDVENAVVSGKSKLVAGLVQEALDEGCSAPDILNGMINAMGIVGERFKKNEIFVPEMLVAARAMKKGVDVLKPHLASGSAGVCGKAIIGTVAGDLHDIGKNLVAMMIESAGFEQNEEKKKRAVRFDLMLHAYMMVQSGIPMLYSGDEIGQVNDYTYKNDPEKRVDSRYIHRGKFDWKLADGRKRKGTVQKELFDGIGKLRSIRSKEKVFDASANVWTLDTWENGILGVVRELEGEQMTALFNFAEEDRTAWIEEEGEYMDLYTGKKVSLQAIKMEGHSFVLAKKC